MKKILVATLFGGLTFSAFGESSFNYDSVSLRYVHSTIGLPDTYDEIEADSLHTDFKKEISGQFFVGVRLAHAWMDENVQYSGLRIRSEADATEIGLSIGRYFVVNERIDLTPELTVGHLSSEVKTSVSSSSTTFDDELTTYGLTLASNIYADANQTLTLTPALIFQTDDDDDGDIASQFSLRFAGKITRNLEAFGGYVFDIEDDFYSGTVGMKFYY